MKSQRLFCTLLLWLVFLCNSATAQDVIPINGSNTLGNAMVPVLIQGWMKKYGYNKIVRSQPKAGFATIAAKRDDESLLVEITGKGSRLGFQDLVNGETEIAMMSQSLSAKEIDDGWQLGTLNSPDQEHVIALQAITAIVSSDNQTAGLDIAQLSKIISGEISNWQQLGGKPGIIRLHAARQNTGLADVLSTMLSVKNFARNIVLHRNSNEIRAAVALDPNAIGIVEFSSKHGNCRALPIRVGSRLIPADKLHIMTEDYPLTRRLYFYPGQMITALGRGFLDYAESEEGQRYLADHGYLCLAPVAYSAAGKSNFPKDYLQWIDGASRLSFTFRFGNSFAIFDSRGAQDLVRLKDFMHRPENKNRKVILVGHAEKQSTALMENSISNEHADLVANALAEVGINPTRVRGVGYAMPLSSANKGWYRNRRVEVWLR